MALTRTETQITWSSANSKTLSAATRSDSDEIVFGATTVAAAISVRVDNQGTPASGDVLNVYLKQSVGDVDNGGGSNDYDSDEHALLIMVLDTYSSNIPGEDPAQKTVEIPVSAKAIKLSVDSPNAATRNMVVNARLIATTA